MKVSAGVIAHRVCLASISDNRFDGDMVSVNFTMTDESIKEVHDYFKLRRAYVGTDGLLINSVMSKTISLVVHNLMRDQ